jgi:4-amino-4-deoxy-L-arabinose transferase-like glycosyltransferase
MPSPPDGGRDETPPPVPAKDGWTVFLLALLVLSAFAGVRDLWDADEGRYAAVARDMERSGDYVTPREAGMRFMDKPPLLYWMEVASFRVLGHTPFAARLPCIVAGAALAAVVFLLARQWTRDRRASWFAAAVAATSAAGVGFSRTVTTDMPLVAAFSTGLYGAFRALSSDAVVHRVVLGAGLGLGLLAKGALAIVLPALVAVAWTVVGSSPKRVLRIALSPVAWGVALAIAGPWYALVESRNPGFLRHFFVYEHFGRFTRKWHRDFVPFWLYVPVLLAMLAPWTPFLRHARLPEPVPVGRRSVPAHRVAWAWTLSCLLFFTLGRAKLFTYVLPAAPPLFVLAGARLSELVGRGGRSARHVSWFAFAVGALVVVVGVALRFGWPFEAGPTALERIPTAGTVGALAAIPLLLVPLAFAVVRTPAARGAALFAATAALWWGVDLAAARFDPIRSARALAEVLERERREGDLVVSLDRYPQGLRFYSDVDARIAENPLPGQVHTQREIVEPFATYDGKGRLLTMAELRSLWASSTRVLLVGRGIDLRHEFPDGRLLAGPLAGAQRSDLFVAVNR